MKRQSSNMRLSGNAPPRNRNSASSGGSDGHGVKFDFFKQGRRESTTMSDNNANYSSRKSMAAGKNMPLATKVPPGSSTFSSRLQSTEWYHSLVAERIRVVFNGKPFAVLMILALLIALFLPDLFVIMGVRHNIGKDVVLTMVMFLFVFELVGLTAVDAMYVGSFFWMMDIIGTFSMIFDISFILGADATTARTTDGSGTKKNLTLLRAARAARVGARAGRLSRVLRMLREWSGFFKNDEKKSNRGFAVVISNQLANSVATRVACLTILLVMVIPQFDILSFPQNDYALQTWVQRLSLKYRTKSAEGFQQELQQMVDFFEDDNYGPYMACHGYKYDEDNFVCTQHVTDWQPDLPEPARLGSALLVHSDTFLVGFNMDGPIKFEAQLAIMNILFIIFAMVGSGLLLSSVVTELAVRPLERMLLTVRQIASTVFKFSKDVEEEGEEEEEEEEIYDVEGTSEMELLEKVVQKLAVVAELQTKNDHLDTTTDMKEEDIGILSMMRGKNVKAESGPSKTKTRGNAARRKLETPASALEEIGVSIEEYDSLGFNVLALTKAQKTTVAIFTIANFHAPGDGFVRTQDENQKLKRFVQTVEKSYLDNPFHNFAHAVDVVHMLNRLMRKISSDEFLTELDQFALLIASVAHDLGHSGVNNGFLSETSDALALQYNDRSPLENMHCAKLYNIVGDDETNVFSKMSKEQFKEVRKICIEAILHTDMMSHQAIVKDLQMTYQMNSEVFTNHKSGEDGNGASDTAAEVEVFNQTDVKTIIINTMLHSADVSNPCRTWEVSKEWAMKVVEEFFNQGDKERNLGIPVQFLNDRYKLNKPNSQIGFIEFMISPFIFAQIRLWPNLAEMGEQLIANLALWEEMWIEEVGPEEDDKQKVRSRIEKVNENCNDAKTRGAS